MWRAISRRRSSSSSNNNNNNNNNNNPPNNPNNNTLIPLIPGPFVVLQGTPGDGMLNTMVDGCYPELSDDEDNDGRMRNVNEEEEEEERKEDLVRLSTDDDGDDDDDDFQHVDREEEEGVILSSSLERRFEQHQQQPSEAELDSSAVISEAAAAVASGLISDGRRRRRITEEGEIVEGGGSMEDSFIVVDNEEEQRGVATVAATVATTVASISTATRARRRDYNQNRRRRRRRRRRRLTSKEKRAMTRWKSQMIHRAREKRIEMLNESTFPLPPSISTFTSDDNWWQRNGRLKVFESLPRPHDEDERVIIGDLVPGCTVMGTDALVLDVELNILWEYCTLTTIINPNQQEQQQDTLQSEETQQKEHKIPPNSKEKVTFLKIESPFQGYILFSLSTYPYLLPGLPSSSPNSFLWRVTCPDGAWIRSGLELNSSLVGILAPGTICNVSRKTVNSMGLSRLKIDTVFLVCEEEEEEEEESLGWASQTLNPLSGQNGPIFQVLSHPPCPSLYRVIYEGGAVVRRSVELSSVMQSVIPLGEMLLVCEKRFTDHPEDRCLERLRLVKGGWISVRLNTNSSESGGGVGGERVVEFVGLDGRWDLEDGMEGGVYYLDRMREEGDDDDDDNDDDNDGRSFVVGRELSSIIDDDDDQVYQQQQQHVSTTTITNTSMVPTLFRGGLSSTNREKKQQQQQQQHQEKCLICLTEKRTATIVHGETGHVACCLACARILKARGDRCPVCRSPIDSIIQQFWA